MTIEQLPSGNWRVTQMIEGVRYRVVVDHKPGKREAEKLLAAETRHAPKVKSKTTLGQAAKKYIDAREPSCSPSTLAGYDVVWRNLPSWLSELPIGEVTAGHVQRYINEMLSETREATQRPLALKTVRNRYGFLRSVLSDCRPDLTIKCKVPFDPKKDVVIPEDEDVKQILNLARGGRYEIPLSLAALGLRRSEICALTLEDLNGTDLYIHRTVVRGRTGEWITKERGKTAASTRHVTIPQALADKIRTAGTIYDGDPGRIQKWLAAAEEKLGIKNFSLHKLRHYFCSTAAAMNIDEATLLAMGGWSTPHIMKSVYRHAQETHAAAEREKYAEHLGGILADG